ncbi:MAG: (Fe-S)-binding protein [Thermodesulfobacteriota bacterium]
MSEPSASGYFHPSDAPSYKSIVQCMRCGFCLAVCPTYALTNRERSSPRGRVALARAVSEGRLEFTPAVGEEAFFCLDCKACSTACPSGVRVGTIMELCRNQEQVFRPPSLPAGMLRDFILRRMLPSPALMETSLLPLRLYQRLGLQWAVRQLGISRFLPGVLAKLEGLLPELGRPLRMDIPPVIPALGKGRGRVAFFLGCAMSLVFPEVSRQTARVLAHQGFEVVTPREVKCCGAPHLAEGDRESARRLALVNLDLFLGLDADAIVTDCAGCGCALKEYEELLEGRAGHERLVRFRAKVRDISEFLAEAGVRDEGLRPVPLSVTYHEPCHLVHGQGLSGPPRQVIRQIPGVELREMKESSWCCGMAGSFALKELETSRSLLERKLGHVRATGADALITANPGCHLQLASGLRELGMKQPVLHIVELLGRSLPP